MDFTDLSILFPISCECISLTLMHPYTGILTRFEQVGEGDRKCVRKTGNANIVTSHMDDSDMLIV